jgi:1,4-alpha-glucan branching enzyme
MRTSRLAALLALILALAVVSFPSASWADFRPSISTQPGMGARVSRDGTAFRVWAPNARRAFVELKTRRGTWHSYELAPENGASGGNFSGDISGVGDGQEYRYVFENSKGSRTTRSDPRAFRMTNSSGVSVVVDQETYRWKTRDFHAPAARKQVIYELHLGTFAPSGPGVAGTWNEARAKLPELANLGINMIEIMPPAEFAGDFSWGYNPAYPFAPESAYGAPDDAKGFIDTAHGLGIGVIIDVVHNHWGPGDLGMWAFDGETFGSGGIYFYTDWRRETPWGPRPDYGRSEVRDFIVDNARMWLDAYRADGLRWDSTPNIHSVGNMPNPEGWSILQRIGDEVARKAPWKTLIAEDLRNDPMITRPVSERGAGFTSQWDPRFIYPIRDAILAQQDSQRSMASVRDAISANFDGLMTRRVIYTESHDDVANGRQRNPEMIWPGNASSLPSRKRSTLAAAIALTSPGTPMLFQGQECLESGDFRDTVAVDWSKCTRFRGIRKMYSDLVGLRRNLSGKTAGLTGDHVNVHHINDSDKVIAYHRWDRGGAQDDVIVVANFSSRALPSYGIGLPRGGRWKIRFNSDDRVYSPDFGGMPSTEVQAMAEGRDGLAFYGSVALGPYSIVILSQDR